LLAARAQLVRAAEEKGERMTTQTRVVFRRWDNGDIIALFPDLEEGEGYCLSYEHVGQHGGADYRIINDTEPAKETEYDSLFKELSSIGYNLRVIKHR